MPYHIAQVNIAQMVAPLDSPLMHDFVANLDRINAVADDASGFVWRLMGDGNDATSLRPYEDERIIVNMSVWESPETLEKFVFQTVHRNIYARKHEFFEAPKALTVALWWIEDGHIPTLEEAKERLDHLNAHGPSDFAFGWADLPSAKLWQEKRCG